MTSQFLGLCSIDANKSRWSYTVWLCLIVIGTFLGWASCAPLDEVTFGAGRVVPLSRAQTIQSLEGGILAQLLVREGDIVDAGQTLAILDDARFRASYGELDAKIASLEATAVRLKAQMTDGQLAFPSHLLRDTELIERETSLFASQSKAVGANIQSLEQSLALVSRELELTLPLVSKGAASEVEIIRLRQQVVETKRKIEDIENQYLITAKEAYTKTMSELEPARKLNEGRRDQLDRTTVKAPVRGTIKNIEVSTIGGVIQPGGTVMEIVPLEDQLLVEARINPRDIAYMRPGMQARVKLTAYDSSIYGDLEAAVEQISPDTFVDETDKRVIYYRVYVKTARSTLKTRDGVEHAITPGMVATVDFRTGSRTVLEYLIKPLNKVGEAMRER